MLSSFTNTAVNTTRKEPHFPTYSLPSHWFLVDAVPECQVVESWKETVEVEPLDLLLVNSTKARSASCEL